MEPIPPTLLNRSLALLAGMAFGIGVQALFLFIVTNVIGPIPPGFNGKLVALILLFLVIPLLSFIFVRIPPGSIGEDFFKGFQIGALIWLVKIFISIL